MDSDIQTIVYIKNDKECVLVNVQGGSRVPEKMQLEDISVVARFVDHNDKSNTQEVIIRRNPREVSMDHVIGLTVDSIPSGTCKMIQTTCKTRGALSSAIRTT